MTKTDLGTAWRALAARVDEFVFRSGYGEAHHNRLAPIDIDLLTDATETKCFT